VGGNERVRAYLGLGANVGDARGTLRDAVAALARLPGSHVAAVSRLYRTRPVGVTDQPEFLNAVVALDRSPTAERSSSREDSAAIGATRLLVQLKDLEREFGRRRRQRWGPRELDLDLLLYGDARLALTRPPAGVPLSAAVDRAAATHLLEVPHPSMRDRLFVLAPLADLAPDLVPPSWRESIGARRTALERDDPDAVHVVGEWNEAAGDWE
jgi:2-amino-4-hydroxy-6-hydroxymethyldihydropteridine diphosphokinase